MNSLKILADFQESFVRMVNEKSANLLTGIVAEELVSGKDFPVSTKAELFMQRSILAGIHCQQKSRKIPTGENTADTISGQLPTEGSACQACLSPAPARGSYR